MPDKKLASSALSSSLHVRRFVAAALVGLAGVVVGQTGCGDASDGSQFGTSSGGPAEPSGPTDPFGNNVDGGDGEGGIDPGQLGTLTVDPPTADIQVVVTNGVATTNPPVTFKASYNGQQVAATWLFDRGELGGFGAPGIFTATGKGVGEGTVTARYGAREGSAKIKVTVKASQNGTPPDAPPAPGPGDTGGYGGVGGEPLGPAVDATTVAKLKGPATAPTTPAELSFLYPYDKTVWPKGLLPPLVMWNTTHANADAVYVKLSQGNFAFEGTYSLAVAANGQAIPAGDPRRRRLRLEDTAWRTATSGNQGDDLVLEVRIHDGGTVYGPITRTWKVAPGILRGTVYYNSYDSKVVTNNGAVLAIKPRSPKPALALPGAQSCHACHVVSADGSTMFAQDAPDPYSVSASYDLKNANPYGARATYTGADSTRKFSWSAPYPDGSFALSSSRYAREPSMSNSNVFSRASNGAARSSSGLTTAVTSAVTPSFSPDGKKVAFNFWAGAGANGVAAGNGHSLAVFDHGCGAAAGSVTCTGNSTFSNLRQVYSDANRWPGWPSFLPDAKAVVFHNTLQVGEFSPSPPDANSRYNNILTTWFRGKAEIWIAADGGAQGARRLDALNGVGYLPTGDLHPDDTSLNYMPTVNPVASGGYYWVVFTSRRLYGNVLTSDPWADGSKLDGLEKSVQKKLWVAAVDINTGAIDPSHPAFYLPGQELAAGNARGFWVVDPCKANGTSCETGDECCNGFCRDDGNGKLVCQDKPPGTQCVQEFEKCTVDADCCDPLQKCINGKCSLERPPVVK